MPARVPAWCFQPPGTYLRRLRARQPALSSAWSCAASTARGSCAAAVDVRHVKLSRVRASSRPTDSSAELLGSLPRRAAAADRARVAPSLIYPCLSAARHDPANSHLHRVSPLADVHRTQHEDLGLSPRPSGGPKSVEARLTIQSLRRRDLTFRASIFAPNCAFCVQRAAPRCSCYVEAWVAGGGVVAAITLERRQGEAGCRKCKAAPPPF